MRTSVVASMGTTLAHRDEVRAPAAQATPRAERREAPLATRVSVKRVMRAFKRI
ncbi:MAG TPA: hypothetical protein VHA76_11895 [Solirubrobacterales bacterium]|nr:hypothetical protein [Solirubrobacterales bacterium]